MKNQLNGRFTRKNQFGNVKLICVLIVLSSLHEVVTNFTCQTPDDWLSRDILIQRTVSPPLDFDFSKKWTNGVVKYKFNDTLTINDKVEVKRAFDEYHLKTCIRFEPWVEGDIDYVSIEVDNSICGKANVCKIGGYQFARFGGMCRFKQTMIHQLAHTLCLGHEHQRIDRDAYLSFRTCTSQPRKIDALRLKRIYDYVSITHPPCQSCEGGWRTKQSVSGQLSSEVCGRIFQSGLSVMDADTINWLYDCRGCKRHRWVPLGLLTPTDKENMPSFGYKTKNNLPMYACRAPIVDEVAAGTYNESTKTCSIAHAKKTININKDVEVLTIPGGLVDECSAYEFIKKYKTLLFSNAIQVGELFRHEDYTLHLVHGVDSSGSNYYGKREQSFKFLRAEIPALLGGHDVHHDFEILTCRVNPLCAHRNGSKVENIRARVSSVNVIMVVLVILLFIILGIATSYYFLRYRQARALLSRAEVQDFLEGSRHQTTDPKYDGILAKKFEKEYEIPKDDICIDMNNVLGTGAFGIVYGGTAKGLQAAIKTPNRGCTAGSFKSFLNEVKVLCYLGTHQNILGFIGAHVSDIRYGILHIATELCLNGSLESFLRKKKHVVEDHNLLQIDAQNEDVVWLYELHRFSYEIACGMEYIATKNVVHRDLSTRNVFLDDGNVCKIGDFGLSRKLDEYQLYVKQSQEPMPWKWLAYESLTKMEFTCKSDVWGYGVTVWEIFSLGATPYAGLTWTPGFTNELEKGIRLPLPTFAVPEIYTKLQDCWHLDPNKRTSCTAMVEVFRKFCDSEYVSLNEKEDLTAKIGSLGGVLETSL